MSSNYPSCSRKLFSDYENSVISLANKLPQWNPDTADYSRRYYSALSSLFEEAGELSGLISKKRIRKHYWKADVKSLEDIDKIKHDFTSEASDFLWVLICSNYCLGGLVNNVYDYVFASIEEVSHMSGANEEFIFEQSLYEVFSSLVLLRSASIFDDRDIRQYMLDLVKTFSCFLYELYQEYDISLTDLIMYNMDKLGKRYDENGQRTDGK